MSKEAHLSVNSKSVYIQQELVEMLNLKPRDKVKCFMPTFEAGTFAVQWDTIVIVQKDENGKPLSDIGSGLVFFPDNLSELSVGIYCPMTFEEATSEQALELLCQVEEKYGETMYFIRLA